ncbi:hypothetical protein Dtox_2073 [Desulfofarcimen acetoxidans DSM 771]|jgi:hypothetical protein|uniref:Uncharacterized protein n=1 Tax=Desulfofarcimen acetoxidans (strain ATCC 49208 / DSM 771 / KCTC 5769 / VKM B-1644 / 5575) TaxID=485916 RepID=C8VYZ2_DESAS|nr:hypothetical protein [Desulfofarcimen acetoxidans]ACV62902.1 hypothetical protein Dtox_2073 [Desulfofarcimen acetoxidans DSM 771]
MNPLTFERTKDIIKTPYDYTKYEIMQPVNLSNKTLSLLDRIENELFHRVIFVTPVKLKEIRKWNVSLKFNRSNDAYFFLNNLADLNEIAIARECMRMLLQAEGFWRGYLKPESQLVEDFLNELLTGIAVDRRLHSTGIDLADYLVETQELNAKAYSFPYAVLIMLNRDERVLAFRTLQHYLRDRLNGIIPPSKNFKKILLNELHAVVEYANQIERVLLEYDLADPDGYRQAFTALIQAFWPEATVEWRNEVADKISD